MKKILLVDANLLLFRSFYAAYAISKTSNNMTTHLFFNSVLEVIKKEKPDFVFFAFDAHAKTKRQETFEEYKAGRIRPPKEIYEQKDLIIKILNKMKFKWIEVPGDEADDIIATICTRYKNTNEIFIFSEDKDLMQLIDMNVFIIVKNKDKKIKQKYEKIWTENFFEKFNILPSQVIDFKGIAGDNSDNLTGIKGIGPKTTIELLSKFKSLEGIYENLDFLTQKQKEAFIKNKDNAFLCKKLATLNTNVDININLDESSFFIDNLNNIEVEKILSDNNLKKLIELIKKW